MSETLTKIIPTRKHARKVLEVVDAGLSNGLGDAEPGKMCVEAAVCFALGLPHGDNPPCVGPAVRSFKIALKDEVLSLMAEIGVGALQKAGSPGCEWLDLCGKEAK